MWPGGGGGTAAPALLHISLLLSVNGDLYHCDRCRSIVIATNLQFVAQLYAGAGLATAARLKWDPSTYIALRELFPHEYYLAAVALTLAPLALLALGHLALCALATARTALRRALLYLYAGLMTCVVVSEVVWAWWTGARAVAWAQSDQAQELAEALEVRDHLRPLLHYLGRWHPLPAKLRELIDEAEADLPRNGYVALAASVALLALQVAGVTCACLAARRSRPLPLPAPAPAPSTPAAASAPAHSLTLRVRHGGERTGSEDSEPLKGSYMNGRPEYV